MNRTKKLIGEMFWQILEEKPYNKITVRDIVDRCQISRNAFYYHYHDIPELLEITIEEDADALIQTYGRFGSPIDCLTPLAVHCQQRRKALLHIYNSTQREVFANQLERICLYVITRYVETVTVDLTLSPDDKQLLIRFYKCTLVGIFLDWMNERMSYDMVKSVERIAELLDGSGKQAFLKATRAPGSSFPQ